MMKTIITGSKEMDNMHVVQAAIEASDFAIDEVVTGAGRGVDHLGEQWARKQGLSVKTVPPDRLRYGDRATAQQEHELIRRADALIVVWDGRNRDTLRLINHARRRGLKVHIHRVG
jgi:hypothetical protein